MVILPPSAALLVHCALTASALMTEGLLQMVMTNAMDVKAYLMLPEAGWRCLLEWALHCSA